MLRACTCISYHSVECLWQFLFSEQSKGHACLTVGRLAAACVAARTERLYASYLADESQTSPEHIGLIDKCIWTVCIV